AVHRGEDIVVAHVVDSPQRPRITPMGFGFNDAAHATAFGKVLLAAMDRDRREAYLKEHGQPAMTDATITGAAELAAELKQVAKSGIAIEREEFFYGSSCMAAHVTDAAGHTVVSVYVSMYAADLSARAPQTMMLLRHTAGLVRRAIQGTSLLPK